MSTSYSLLRRTLAQRLNYWGGGISNDGVGLLSTQGSSNTAIDTVRPEPDDEWDDAWIVLNPGSSDQVNSPTIWRRIASDGGWILTSGTMTIQGTWPSPYTNGPPANTPYELYKIHRPENWLQAINWALSNSYPQRHVKVVFEIPQDYYSRVINWGSLAKSLALTTPISAPTVTEAANGNGKYQPGTYTFAYTYYNDLGETLAGPTSSVTIVSANSEVRFAAITGVPAAALGINYYGSQQGASTQLAQMSVGTGSLDSNPPTGSLVGTNNNGTVPAITFPNPAPFSGVVPPSYNTTSIDTMQLHSVEVRMNPGAFPEIWNVLGPQLWKPLGGNTIELAYLPLQGYNLRLIGTAIVPLMSSESDTTTEPTEMIYAGAESYLWSILAKTSTIVNVNWSQLAAQSLASYKSLLGNYAMDKPSDERHRPAISVYP